MHVLVRASLIAFAGTATALFALAEPATEAPFDTKSRIAALAADEFATRQCAQQELIDHGEAIVEPLRAALAGQIDDEQRSRIESILRQIAEESVIGATRISLDLSDVPINDAIAAINAQLAGGRTLLYPRELWQDGSGPRVTIRSTRQPLWSVLREITQQAGIEITPCEDGLRLAPGCGGLARGPATVAGPILIAAGRIYHQRSIEFTQGSLRNCEFGIQFNALVEPKIKTMPGASLVRVLEAVDDRGNQLLPPGGSQETFGGSGPYWSFAARLQYPDKPGARIARINGELVFSAATRFETIELTDLSGVRNVVTVAGRDCRFIVRSVTQNGERYEVALAGAAPAGDVEAFHRVQQMLYTADVRLLDARSQSILRSAGPNFIASDHPNTLELTMTFDRNLSDGRPTPGAAHRLLWPIPVESKPITLPFEIRDLPMP